MIIVMFCPSVGYCYRWIRDSLLNVHLKIPLAENWKMNYTSTYSPYGLGVHNSSLDSKSDILTLDLLNNDQ